MSTSIKPISFARGAPSLDIIDVEGLSTAAARAFANDPGGVTAYGTAVGYPPLRRWIAEQHGVDVEQVLVTNGSLQADAFVFDLCVREGDPVIVELPTYDRTLLGLQGRGARVVAVEMEEDGIDVVALEEKLKAGLRPTLAHIIPNFQNPSGYTLSLAKRERLLALAEEYDFHIFEDDPYLRVRFEGEALPTMLSLDKADRIIYASSFSKTVCPGVRVGYMIGPREFTNKAFQLATNTYISPSMVAQAIVHEFCQAGSLERSIAHVQGALRERCATLVAALQRNIPEAEFTAPTGGYFMWVTLPAEVNIADVEQRARELGVLIVKGSDFVVDGGHSSMRLAYSGVTPTEIEEGVSRLAAAVHELATTG